VIIHCDGVSFFYLTDQMVTPHSIPVPIFWGHGTLDPLVKYQFGQASAEYLVRQVGIQRATDSELVGLNFKPYPGVMHSTIQQELDDLRAWLKRAIPPNVY
jgi:lysophospholipase I